ncbi:MAG: DUF2125 domain-containing protein, partial [Pseudomonadota bacterium]
AQLRFTRLGFFTRPHQPLSASSDTSKTERPVGDYEAGEGFDVALRIDGLERESLASPLLGNRIDRLLIDTHLREIESLAAFAAALAASHTEALQGWALNEGSVGLRRAELSLEGLDLLARGALALEPSGHLRGQIMAEAIGIDTVFDRLVAQNVLEPQAANVLNRWIGILSAVQCEAGRTCAPLRFDRGGLFLVIPVLGPQRVSDLPPLF